MLARSPSFCTGREGLRKGVVCPTAGITWIGRGQWCFLSERGKIASSVGKEEEFLYA